MNLFSLNLEKIIEDTSFPAFILSKDNRILLCNDSFADFLGKAKEEILGKYCYEVVHELKKFPDFCPLKEEVCLLSECDKGESVCPHCPRANFQKGLKGFFIREFWEPKRGYFLRALIFPLYSLEGELTGYLHFIEDHSEKIRLFEEAVVALIITTPDGEILQTNKKARQLFKMKEGKVDSKTFKMQTFWVNPQDWERFLQGLINSEAVYNFETELKDLEGNGFYALISSKLFKKREGLLIYMAIEDITSYLKVKEEAFTYIRKIIDFLPIGIAAIDARDRVIFVNSKFSELTGYSQDEILGASLHQLLVADEKLRESAKHVFKEIAAGRKSYLSKKRVEFIARKKDGKTFPVEVYFDEFYLNGERYFIGTLQDITERKLFEERMLREEKEYVIEKIAGGLAHDLNNLLMIVKGYLEMLHNRSKDYGEKERNYVEKILNSFERMKHLVSELFILSRGEFQTTEVVQVSKFLHNWVPFFLQGTAIKLNLEVEPNLILSIKESHFLSLIQNLVINAKEAMDNVGELVVKAYGKNNNIFIEIIDSGCGISSEILKDIFEPGFSTKPYGSGLGLYVVKRIMDLYGGEIQIQSEVGKGTKVLLKFPLEIITEKVKGRVLEIKEEEKPHRVKRKLKILILDDEDEIREVLKEFLSDQGYEVETAENGDKALEKVLNALEINRPFTHFLLDLTVPQGKGGVYFLKKLIEKGFDLNQVKVIFMTGFTEKEIQEEAKGVKVDFVLFKPFSLYRISELLKEL